jgi:hypothetical protein
VEESGSEPNENAGSDLACLDVLPEQPTPPDGEPGCFQEGLSDLIGEWVNHQGDTVTIDDQLVMGGDTELCVDSWDHLHLITSYGPSDDPRTRTLRGDWYSTPNLLAWTTWQRASDCGEGAVGRWRLRYTVYGEDVADGQENELNLYPDGTAHGDFREDADDSSMQDEFEDRWVLLEGHTYDEIQLDGRPNIRFLTDGHALWPANNYLTRAD